MAYVRIPNDALKSNLTRASRSHDRDLDAGAGETDSSSYVAQ
jgi:hypothetical protein